MWPLDVLITSHPRRLVLFDLEVKQLDWYSRLFYSRYSLADAHCYIESVSLSYA